jgi:hypothetical protein
MDERVVFLQVIKLITYKSDPLLRWSFVYRKAFKLLPGLMIVNIEVLPGWKIGIQE